jgi:hypothetical protein
VPYDREWQLTIVGSGTFIIWCIDNDLVGWQALNQSMDERLYAANAWRKIISDNKKLRHAAPAPPRDKRVETFAASTLSL